MKPHNKPNENLRIPDSNIILEGKRVAEMNQLPY